MSQWFSAIWIPASIYICLIWIGFFLDITLHLKGSFWRRRVSGVARYSGIECAYSDYTAVISDSEGAWGPDSALLAAHIASLLGCQGNRLQLQVWGEFASLSLLSASFAFTYCSLPFPWILSSVVSFLYFPVILNTSPLYCLYCKSVTQPFLTPSLCSFFLF